MVSLNTQPLSSQTSKLVHLQLMYSELRMPNLPAVAAVLNPPQPLTSGFPGLGFWDLFLGGHGSSPSHSLPSWSGQNSQKGSSLQIPVQTLHTYTQPPDSSHVSVFGKRLNQTP